MRLRSSLPVVVACLAAIATWSRHAPAQRWQFDELASTVDLIGNSFADDGIVINGGPDLQMGASSGFVSGYNSGAGMHQFVKPGLRMNRL